MLLNFPAYRSMIHINPNSFLAPQTVAFRHSNREGTRTQSQFNKESLTHCYKLKQTLRWNI